MYDAYPVHSQAHQSWEENMSLTVHGWLETAREKWGRFGEWNKNMKAIIKHNMNFGLENGAKICYKKSTTRGRCMLEVHSVEQKSIGLIFHTSRSGSHVTYSCHHNLSHFTFPIFVHSWHFSVFHSWLEKEGRELPKAENWPSCDNTVINPKLSARPNPSTRQILS